MNLMASLKKNFMFQGMWQIILMILPLITSPILSRSLGAEGVGIYAYITTITSYFCLFLNLGMEKYGNRLIASSGKDRKLRSKNFSEVFTLHLLISLVVNGAYIVYVMLFSQYPGYQMILLLTLLSSTISIWWLYAGVEEFGQIFFRDLIIKIVTFSLILILIKDSDDLNKYIIFMALAPFIGSISYWFNYKKYIDFQRVEIRSLKKHIKPILILFIPVLLESVYNTLDKLMLGTMSTTVQVGFYDNASKALIAKNLVCALGTVMLPRMAGLFASKDNSKILSFIEQSIKITLIMAIGMGIGTAAIAKEFSPIFWGTDFNECIVLIEVMAFSIIFSSLSNIIRMSYLIPAERDREYILSAAMGAIADFFLNLIMIPKLGAYGAATATLIAEAIVLLTQMIVIRKDIPIFQYIFKNIFYIIPGIAMLFIVRMIGDIMGIHVFTIAMQVAVGGIFYLGSCVIYWKVRGDDYCLNIVKSFTNQIIKKIKG